jgi:hypothetical protein
MPEGNGLTALPNFNNKATDPLGFLGGTNFGESVRGLSGANWLSTILSTA